MLTELMKQIKTAIILLFIFTLLTGLLYPGLVTLIAQQLFPWQANGSMIKYNDQTIGSLLIGQSFTDPAYFWGRPSATQPFPYNANYSAGSNLGATNPTLFTDLKQYIEILHSADKQNQNLIPVDLVTTSASGLDPDISIEAAIYQAPRIARIRHVSENNILNIIDKVKLDRMLKTWGEPRINVLQLNIALSSTPLANIKRDRHERK